MKLFTQMTKMALFAASLSFAGASVAAEPMDLDSLLKTLEEGKSAQSAQNKQREQEFMARQNEQVQMLNNTQAKRNQMLAESERLETQFEENEIKLANLTDTLSKRMGSLKELFGVLQQVAGDSSNKFSTSVVSAEIAGRSTFMDELAQKMGSTSKLASIEDIEKVWFELQREMTEQGKVSRFTTDVIVQGGEKAQQEVVRVGAFNLISNGKYLEFNPVTNTLSELNRQPV
ncbi:MAG TPA: energy transducer TonB, partial [Pseudoalteromonas sp.]|nr:energy transducer TonB [Pseudoalteromonas sp.]